jgi:hypothetical protein
MAHGHVLSHPAVEDQVVREELRVCRFGAASYVVHRRKEMSPATAYALLDVLTGGDVGMIATLFRRPDVDESVIGPWIEERTTRSRAILGAIASRPELRSRPGFRAYLLRSLAIGDVAARLAEDARPEEFAELLPRLARTMDQESLATYVDRVQAAGGRLTPAQLARIMASPAIRLPVFAVLHRIRPTETEPEQAENRGRARAR